MVEIVHALPTIVYGPLANVHEERRVALFTTAQAWDALSGTLSLPIVCRAEPANAALSTFEALSAAIPNSVEVLYAVGGGLVFDAAKMAATRRHLPLIGVPTALSADALLTSASGFRRDRCVFYLDTNAPCRLYVDWQIIRCAPVWIRAAGICDVLSIATGLWDWMSAEQSGKLPVEQSASPFAIRLSRDILDEAIAIAGSAGRGEISGLEQLLVLLGLEVQLCNFIGHARPEEGSEHYFAYSVENLVGHGLPHGDLVGPGIIAMAAAQGQDIDPLRSALTAAGVRLDRIPRKAAQATLAQLASYSREHNLPFGIAHELDEAKIHAALDTLW